MASLLSHRRSGLVARYVADSHLASLLSHHRSGRVARYVADSHMASLLSHRWADLRGGLVPPMVCMLSFDSSSMSMVTANAFLKSGEVTEQVVQASLLSELLGNKAKLQSMIMSSPSLLPCRRMRVAVRRMCRLHCFSSCLATMRRPKRRL